MLNLPIAVLCRVHGSVGGAEEAVFSDGIFRVEGDANAGGGMEDGAIDAEWRVEGTFEAEGDLLDIGAAANDRDQRGKFVAAEAGQRVVGPELALHARCHFLQIQITDLVPVDIVDKFEFIEIDVDESENGSPLAGVLDLRIEALVE